MRWRVCSCGCCRRRWVTPPLDAGLLPGCERAALLAEGALQEAIITLGALRQAKEIAFVNSVRGWKRAELQR